MAGIFHPSRGGTRGGQDQFNWEDVKTDKDREYYLGHSLKAPVGKWQEGKDLMWYASDNSNKCDADAKRKKEIQDIKDMESRAMAAALGYKSSNAGGATSLTAKELQEVLSSGQNKIGDGQNKVSDYLEAHGSKKKKKEKRRKKKKKKDKRKHKSNNKSSDELENSRMSSLSMHAIKPSHSLPVHEKHYDRNTSCARNKRKSSYRDTSGDERDNRHERNNTRDKHGVHHHESHDDSSESSGQDPRQNVCKQDDTKGRKNKRVKVSRYTSESDSSVSTDSHKPFSRHNSYKKRKLTETQKQFTFRSKKQRHNSSSSESE